ncbi:MAG TPA: DNA-formamidopyrimidine glycosylase family protein [Thermoanaerobaculia bacterium]|nr:DNA-formamidopyrimidine glycosylase family protein [Thermoanaerobaculia bacterium]
MPELPEVEIYRRYFERHALGQTIARVDVRDERILGAIRGASLGRRLQGRAFHAVRRHGKHLIAEADEGLWLHLHFGMTGDLAYYTDPADEPRFARVVFELVNGARLAYDDMRLFGVVGLVSGPEDLIAAHRLGPDPLDPGFRLSDFARLVERRRGTVKSFLLSQNIIAGMGNLYADETLFQTAIDPRRSVNRLTTGEVKAVFERMRAILREAIRRKSRGAGHPRSYLVHRREAGERCPRCGGTIRKSVVFGRSTYFCAKHQR